MCVCLYMHVYCVKNMVFVFRLCLKRFPADWCWAGFQRRFDHPVLQSCVFSPSDHLFAPPNTLLACLLRHVVFINPVLPAGPGPAVIGRLTVRSFPFSWLSHQEIRPVAAKRMRARTEEQIMHGRTAMQAGTHLREQAAGKRGISFVSFRALVHI